MWRQLHVKTYKFILINPVYLFPIFAKSLVVFIYQLFVTFQLAPIQGVWGCIPLKEKKSERVSW